MNVIIILVPLISTIFGIMYFYNSKEFTELLLAQPVKRSSIFLGQYFGVAGSLTLSLVLGLGIPFVLYGLLKSDAIFDFTLLLVTGAFLTLIFTVLAFNIALSNENKIKGFGYAVLLWLFMAVIYDGLFLMSLIIFKEYPLDSFRTFGIYRCCFQKVFWYRSRSLCVYLYAYIMDVITNLAIGVRI